MCYLYRYVSFNKKTSVNYFQKKNLLPDLNSCNKLKYDVCKGY